MAEDRKSMQEKEKTVCKSPETRGSITTCLTTGQERWLECGADKGILRRARNAGGNQTMKGLKTTTRILSSIQIIV